MNTRRDLLDLEHQTSEANRAERDEYHAAARHDRTEWRRIGGQWLEADRVPDRSDVEDA